MSGMDQSLVRKILDYDPSTGVMTWKPRSLDMFSTKRACAVWNSRYSGQRAGSVWTMPGQGYQCRVIGINGKRYYEHRIAWIWAYGNPLPDQVDHIDRDATNNRLENLRRSDAIHNKRNMSKHSSNKSGVNGVLWDAGAEKWRAQCYVNGKTKYLGLFPKEDLDLAAMEAMEARIDLGYSQGHGADSAHYHQ